MRALSLLFALSFLPSVSAQAPPSLVDGDQRLYVPNTATQPGDKLTVFSAQAAGDCADFATLKLLPLVPTVNNVVQASPAPPDGSAKPTESTITVLELTSKLAAGQIVCVLDTRKGQTSSIMQVVVGERPTPAATATQPEITPIEGLRHLTITTAPAEAGDAIKVYSGKKDFACDQATSSQELPLEPQSDSKVLDGMQTTVLLKDQLAPKEYICVKITGTGTPLTSKTVITAEAPSATPPVTPSTISIIGKPLAGATSVFVSGETNEAAKPQAPNAAPAGQGSPATTAPSTPDTTVRVAVYQFDATYQAGSKTCADVFTDGMPLSLVTGPGSSGLTVDAGASTPYTITFVRPLLVGTQLCLIESGGKTGSSKLVTVVDATDYGRFVASFTAGAMINNQQQSSNSSTAGIYLDMHLLTSWLRGGRRPCPLANPVGKDCLSLTSGGSTQYYKGHLFQPGFDTFFDARLSPLSVATQTTTTTGTTSSANLNLLTSQQALRAIVGLQMPFRSNGWSKRTNAFTLGPTAVASFDTVLNPSVASGSGSSSTSTGKFNSVYSSWAAGLRMSWDQYPASTDYAPRTLASFQATLGQYSNLPSYECVFPPKGGLPTGVTTSCVAAAASGAAATQSSVSRVLIPRLDLAGTLRFPNFPLVLGFDANLAQYGLPGTPGNIDILNKPGNDVRIYFGYVVDLSAMSKMLGN